MANPKWMLKGRIISKFGSISAFAEHLGKERGTINKKILGTNQMSQTDIAEWADALDMNAEDIAEYFFPQIVSKN